MFVYSRGQRAGAWRVVQRLRPSSRLSSRCPWPPTTLQISPRTKLSNFCWMPWRIMTRLRLMPVSRLSSVQPARPTLQPRMRRSSSLSSNLPRTLFCWGNMTPCGWPRQTKEFSRGQYHSALMLPRSLLRIHSNCCVTQRQLRRHCNHQARLNCSQVCGAGGRSKVSVRGGGSWQGVRQRDGRRPG